MEQLGIQPSLLLAQIVNFSIIAFVLTKLLYKPILSMLAKRKKEIEAGLALTEKMRLEEEKMKVKQDKIMETARRDARELLEAAKKDAQVVEKQIVADAHKQEEEIIAKGKLEVEALRAEMLKGAQLESIVLATKMAERLTASILSGDDQHKLIAKQLKQLESVKV
jgi:F-type H+-transporting ATPase subunit b